MTTELNRLRLQRLFMLGVVHELGHEDTVKLENAKAEIEQALKAAEQKIGCTLEEASKL